MLCPNCLEFAHDSLRFCPQCGTVISIKEELLLMSWHELYNHGCSSYRHNNYIEAEQCFVESIQLNPAHSLSWYNLGTLKLKMKQPQEASKCLLVAKQYNPQHINTRMNLASAYCLIGKSKLAIKELQLILGIYPNCHQAKELLIKLESVKNPEKRHQD